MTHDDEQFEAFLAREAAQYHAPPADVPRDAMWAAIAAARAARGVRPAAHPAAGDAAPATPIAAARPRRPLRHAPWLGMAATLLLGVGIGRYALQRGPGLPAAPVVTAVPGSDAAAGTAPRAAAAPEPSTPATAPARRAETTALAFAPDARRAAAAPAAPRPDRGPDRDGPGAAPARAREAGPSTYSVASQQHLTRAEALVAVVAAMPADAAMDSLTGRWARDVLTNTRLLLDSPAGDDPVRRRLLEDLETVLVQLVQRSGRTAEDRAMIDRTLQRTQLLTRLRTGATGT